MFVDEIVANNVNAEDTFSFVDPNFIEEEKTNSN